MVLAAGGAALEVGSHARYGGVGVAARELELDVAVELFEASSQVSSGPAGPSSPPSRSVIRRALRHDAAFTGGAQHPNLDGAQARATREDEGHCRLLVARHVGYAPSTRVRLTRRCGHRVRAARRIDRESCEMESRPHGRPRAEARVWAARCRSAPCRRFRAQPRQPPPRGARHRRLAFGRAVGEIASVARDPDSLKVLRGATRHLVGWRQAGRGDALDESVRAHCAGA